MKLSWGNFWRVYACGVIGLSLFVGFIQLIYIIYILVWIGELTWAIGMAEQFPQFAPSDFSGRLYAKLIVDAIVLLVLAFVFVILLPGGNKKIDDFKGRCCSRILKLVS